MLEVCSTAEFRTFAMGHSPGSHTYEKYYMGTTAKQDIQAIMHGVPCKDVSHMGGMSLGRAESAPQRLSPSSNDGKLIWKQAKSPQSRSLFTTYCL